MNDLIPCRRRLSTLAALADWTPEMRSQEEHHTSHQTDDNMQLPTLTIQPIGVIETPFAEPGSAPRQAVWAHGATGKIRVLEKFRDGLRDLNGFERIWLIYWLHKATPGNLLVRPSRDNKLRGVFSTRSPSRPTPIGISPVRLLRIRGNVLEVADVDMLNGTPILDIKPYVPAIDSFPDSRSGWLSKSEIDRRRADGLVTGGAERRTVKQD